MGCTQSSYARDALVTELVPQWAGADEAAWQRVNGLLAIDARGQGAKVRLTANNFTVKHIELVQGRKATLLGELTTSGIIKAGTSEYDVQFDVHRSQLDGVTSFDLLDHKGKVFGRIREHFFGGDFFGKASRSEEFSLSGDDAFPLAQYTAHGNAGGKQAVKKGTTVPDLSLRSTANHRQFAIFNSRNECVAFGKADTAGNVEGTLSLVVELAPNQPAKVLLVMVQRLFLRLLNQLDENMKQRLMMG